MILGMWAEVIMPVAWLLISVEFEFHYQWMRFLGVSDIYKVVCFIRPTVIYTLIHSFHNVGFTSSGLLGHGSRQVITSTFMVGPCGKCAQIKHSNHMDTYTWVVCGEVYELRTDIKKTCVSKRLDYMLTMCLLSRFNIQHGWESLYDHLINEHEIPRFVNEEYFHRRSSGIYEANGCGYILDLLIISHQLQVLYPTRDRSEEKSTQTTHIHLRP
jgi:hypothetical protein